MLTIKYISTSEETLKLLLNIRIILSFSKFQLLQKRQFVNYFVKQQFNNKCKRTEFYFLYFTSSLKKYRKYALLSSQSYFLRVNDNDKYFTRFPYLDAIALA